MLYVSSLARRALRIIMPISETQKERTVPDVNIPMFVMLPAAVGLRAIVLLLHVLKQCWIAFTLAVVTFTAVYWILGGFAAFLLLLVSVLTILYHAEDYLLYHPNNPKNSRMLVMEPSAVGMPFESFKIRSIDGTMLHIFMIRQPEPLASSAPTFVFLHGNAGNVGHWYVIVSALRMSNVCGFYYLLKANVLMLEYRGYGLSEGSPSELGICQDARAAVDYLLSRSDINHKGIVLFGRSLGGAVAIDLASHPDYSGKIWCVVVENTFTSIPSMAHILIGSCLRYLPLFCYKNKFMSYDKVMCIVSPTLFISGLSDSLVPPSMMADLHARCGASYKQRVIFKDGTHNETWRCEGYFQALANFLQDVCSRQEVAADQNTVRTQPLLHSIV